LLFKLNQGPRSRGLRCDTSGLFLDGHPLLRRDANDNFEAREESDLRKAFNDIYGDQIESASRIRSVKLVASALNKGDVARAMMTAVLMRLPDPDGPIRISDVDGTLAKAGFNPDEARDERGRWTTGGSSGSKRADEHYPVGVLFADVGMSDASDDAVAEAARRAAVSAQQERTLGGDDAPKIILASAESDDDSEDARFGIGGNFPPIDELIPPTLQRSPAGPAVQYLDNLMSFSEFANQLSFELAQSQMRGLLYQIHKVDPNYVYEAIEPPGGLAGMSPTERLQTIYALQADLAAAIYRVRGDFRPLQEVTLELMQRTANAAYDEAIKLYNAGELNVLLSREVTIGNYVDTAVRTRLRLFFNGLRIPTNSGSAIRVNRRAYNSSGADVTYRVPDARIGNLVFEVSLTAKPPSNQQIRGFFNADFRPAGVVLVRPNHLANNSSYVIWRPKGW